MISEVSLGDVIRAWRAIGATTDDERRAIARLLGFDLRDPTPAEPISTPAVPLRREPAARPAAETPSHGLQAPSNELAQPIELVPLPSARDDPAALPDRGIDRPTAAPVRPLESLFPAGWVRAIASTLTARPAPVGALDVRRTIELIVQQRPIRMLPRLARLVSATEITVVIDRRATIAWFRDDADQLVERLNAVTRAPVSVVISDGAPRLAAMTGSVDPVDDDDALPPAVRIGAAGRVVGITDLGLGSRWSAGDPARASAWADFGLALRARGATLAIVTPVPPERTPPALVRVAACVFWDGRTRAGHIRRLIKRIA